MRKSLIGAAAGALSLAAAGGVAFAGSSGGVDYDLGYTSAKAKASTGFETSIDSTGTADATGKPRAARKVTIRFQRGTRFDTRVLPACSAETLRAEGPNGCPAGSKVGDGEAEAVTGLGVIDPVGMTIEAFNARNAILFYIRNKPGEPNTTLTLEGRLRGHTLTTVVPKLPQPTPYREAILTKFSVDVERASKGRGAKRRHYATTPSSCPKGRWTTTAVFAYDDGTTTVRDSSPCTKTRKRSSR